MKRDKYFAISPRIAKWKIDTPFENWLSYKADHSEHWKKLYVLYYKILDSKYYKGGIPFIKEMINSRKSEWKNYKGSYIIRDMIYCLHRFGLSFQDYCIYDLINKSFSDLGIVPQTSDIKNDTFLKSKLTASHKTIYKYLFSIRNNFTI